MNLFVIIKCTGLIEFFSNIAVFFLNHLNTMRERFEQEEPVKENKLCIK